MSDSTAPTREHTPQPGQDEGSAEDDAPPDMHRLLPGPSRRTRFEGPASPSPSGDEGDGVTLQDAFLNALLENDLPKFEDLMRNKRVNKRFKYGRPHYKTCLEIASNLTHGSKFVHLLLEHVKPNINIVLPEPIHYAAQKGNYDTLQILLADKRTKVYALNSKGQTALHLACSSVSADRVEQYSRCFEVLVPKMCIADLNKPDSNGFTAFHALIRGGRKNGSKKKRPPRPTNGDESSEVGEGSLRSLRRVDDASEQDLEAREELAELLLRLSRGTLDVDSMRAKGRTAREDAELRFPGLRSKLPPRREHARADPHVALMNALRDENLERFVALLEQTDDDGNPALDPNHAFGYPLHTTCLERACEMAEGADFVRALLQAGADPNVPNKLNEKYPIHIACEKGHYKDLDALLGYSKVLVDVNCEDKFGNTPLHSTVDRISDDKRRETGRRKCLESLLENKKLDVTRTNNAGYTALLLAVEDGNKHVIKTFLGTSHFANLDLTNLNFDGNGRSLRFVIATQFPVLRDLLQHPGSPETLRRVERTKDLFELLNPVKEDDFVRQLNYARPNDLSGMNDKRYTLLQRAARYGMVEAARALLDAGVDPNGTFIGNLSPPGVIASYRRHNNVLQLLLEQPNFEVNKQDAKGNTALHYAAKTDKDLETIILLLHHGADMTIRNKLGKSPFGRDHVEYLLDQCVKTNGKNALEEDYELILDYRLLAPGLNSERNAKVQYHQVPPNDQRDENGAVVQLENVPNNCEKLVCEMNFLNMMSNDEELSALLDHPVALSFLQLKWNRVRYLTYFNLGVYIIFMIFLNIFIILVTRKITSVGNNGNNGDRSQINMTDIIIFGAFALFFWMFLFLRELSQILVDSKNYIQNFENYLDWVVLISSLASLFLPFASDITFVKSTPQEVRTVNVITIMLSCIELLLLLGRISRFAKYIEMLKVVIRNYLLPLLSYSVILVAFGLSFHTLCYENSMIEQQKMLNRSNMTNCTEDEPPDFGSWYMSIVMAIVMMIGELEFKSLPDRSPQSIILFVFFVLLVTVVLLNLLTGLAVSDTAKIEDLAQQLRLQSRVGVVLRGERILVNMYNSESGALRCLPVPRWLRARLQRAQLFPGTDMEGRKGHVKPNHTGELALGGGVGELTGNRELLDKATQIISRRGAATARVITLEEVDEHVQEVLKAFKMLEARCGPFPRAEGREALPSVFSEGPDDWEPPETAVVGSREGSDH